MDPWCPLLHSLKRNGLNQGQVFIQQLNYKHTVGDGAILEL